MSKSHPITPKKIPTAAPLDEEGNARMIGALRPLMAYCEAEKFTQGDVLDTALNIIDGSEDMTVVPLASGVFLVGFTHQVQDYRQEAEECGEEIPDIETPSTTTL